MTVPTSAATNYQPGIRQGGRERPMDRVAQFATSTLNAAKQSAENAKPAVMEAGRATVKAGGIFAAISAICLAIVTLLCALLFGY